MRSSFLVIAPMLALVAVASAQTGFPFQNESLRYTVNWPSGLSLGEVTMGAQRSGERWSFQMGVDAGIPGFAVADKFKSSATADLCSVQLERDLSQGGRKSREKTEFDQARGQAHRTTVLPEGGGSSDLDIPSCARDGLTFLYFARRELGQGRVPPPQQVFLGAAYSVRLEYTGAQTIGSDERAPQVTDRVSVSVKGPKSDVTFEAFFARDPARTPLRIKVPFSVGTISLELVR